MNLHHQREYETALQRLRQRLPELISLLGLDKSLNIDSWIRIIDGKLLPRLSPDFPLMIAICGGGSTGKSTLFNSIIGEKLSPSGGKAGINRRILVSAPGELFRRQDFITSLFEPLGSVSKPLEDEQELTVPGCPLYILNSNVPRNMVLIDTPDFDTGAKGEYTNREVVTQALESSDILIYIFTNSNYKNRDNTDFIAKMLTGIGRRKCYLVYRIYSGFDDQGVISHALTVAKNLYGDQAEQYLLGIYRTDEDNAVAAGDRFMELRPVESQQLEFTESLKQLNPAELRPELIASMLDDAFQIAAGKLASARVSLSALRLYHYAIQVAQEQAVQMALQHFPMDLVVKRFVQIWNAGAPSPIRFMRNTGKIVGMPAKAFVGAYRWVSNAFAEKTPQTSKSFKELVEDDLLDAVHSLRMMTTGAEVVVSLPRHSSLASTMHRLAENIIDGKPAPNLKLPFINHHIASGVLNFRIPAHPAVLQAQQSLKQKDWSSAIKLVISQKDTIIKLTENIEKDLTELAENLRCQMKFSDKLRQTFSAVLNVIPATAAITYILATGDPVGGAGIKVKLTGLLGLQDLYALIAIPATSGLSETDQKQIQKMLGPIAQTWLNDKLKTVNQLFEDEISGTIMCAATETIQASENAIADIESIIEVYQPRSAFFDKTHYPYQKNSTDSGSYERPNKSMSREADQTE